MNIMTIQVFFFCMLLTEVFVSTLHVKLVKFAHMPKYFEAKVVIST